MAWASVDLPQPATPITTTRQLRELVHSVLPPRHGKGIDPATRTFQALRIFVNGELEELQRALHAAETLLKKDGRLVVVTFHSLEDRIVKQFMREVSSSGASPSRHAPTLPDATAPSPTFRLVTHKALTASDREIATNPRARSAKLRAAIRTDAKEKEAAYA